MQEIISYIVIKIKYFYGYFSSSGLFRYCQSVACYIEKKGLKRHKRAIFWTTVHVMLFINAFLYIKIEIELKRPHNPYIIENQDLATLNTDSQVYAKREVGDTSQALSASNKEQDTIIKDSDVSKPANSKPKGNYVASKNGTKYYLLSCSGVSRIKEENKVYFVTAEEAKERGLEPAKNCPGL